jgi:hypothetical protein
VCLSFSKSKLLEVHKDEKRDVNYLPYRWLFKDNSIRLNELDNLGYQQYSKLAFENMVRDLSKKHIDYSGECEFRLYSFNEKEYEYPDVSNAINGIIVPRRNLSKFAEQQLIQFSKNMKIEMLYLEWRSDGISITTLEEDEKVYNIIMNNLETDKLQ